MAYGPPPPPPSPLARPLAEWFARYFALVDQGYAYRFYAPAPPPTPVVTARLTYADGRTEEVRLPDRSAWPRLRYQRQMALANHLFVDFNEAQMGGRGQVGDWAPSYARHLCRTRGCETVELFLQLHLIPERARIAEARAHGADPSASDLDDEAFYTVPQRIGEFPCDAL